MPHMEVRLRLNEQDLKAAQEFAGISDPAKLIDHVLRAYVHSRASQALRAFGGSDPEATAPPRRRPPDFLNPSGPMPRPD
jgi:hypothetical protein